MVPKMRVNPLLILGLLSSFALEGGACATSGAIDPLDGVRSVEYSAVLGGGLGFESSIAMELFGGDNARARAFLERLSSGIEKEFAPAGISVVSSPRGSTEATLGSTAWLTASFYGRRQKIGNCANCYVFLARVDLDREDVASVPGEPRDEITTKSIWSRMIIGSCRNEELESELIRAVRSMLGELKRLQKPAHSPGAR
jgi:hypothetical protein